MSRTRIVNTRASFFETCHLFRNLPQAPIVIAVTELSFCCKRHQTLFVWLHSAGAANMSVLSTLKIVKTICVQIRKHCAICHLSQCCQCLFPFCRFFNFAWVSLRPANQHFVSMGQWSDVNRTVRLWERRVCRNH
jgi:hypothetical protein